MKNIKEINAEVAAIVSRVFDQTTREGRAKGLVCEMAFEDGIKSTADYLDKEEEKVIKTLKSAGLYRLYTLLHD